MNTQQQEAEPVTQVSVIGMGTMGAAMARRLLDADMEVSVWARRSSSTKALAEQGAAAYELPTDAVKNADVVISMLPTAEATAEVMFDHSVLEAMRSGAIWVQMATIGVEQTEQLAAQSLELRPEVAFVDAPVSGSRVPAEQGQLLVLASGPPEAEQPLQPVFAALGRDALWLGAAGAGSRLKLVLNTWLAFQTEGAAESAALAETLGVSSAALFDALRGNPLASPYALSKLTKMVDQNFDADFALDWALKDLDLVASAADPAVAPIASAIAERWRRLVHQGASGLDVSAARRGLN
jgi:3-hydroxyisobutyrate dehydrogenase